MNKQAVSTVIGKNCVLEGNIKERESIRIDGLVKGDVYSESKVDVGKTGNVEGNISSHSLFVAGRVRGNINCKERVELFSSGSVEGDITTKIIVVNEGAKITGRIASGERKLIPKEQKK